MSTAMGVGRYKDKMTFHMNKAIQADPDMEDAIRKTVAGGWFPD